MIKQLQEILNYLKEIYSIIGLDKQTAIGIASESKIETLGVKRTLEPQFIVGDLKTDGEKCTLDIVMGRIAMFILSNITDNCLIQFMNVSGNYKNDPVVINEWLIGSGNDIQPVTSKTEDKVVLLENADELTDEDDDKADKFGLLIRISKDILHQFAMLDSRTAEVIHFNGNSIAIKRVDRYNNEIMLNGVPQKSVLIKDTLSAVNFELNKLLLEFLTRNKIQSRN
jgi:hypothetical protein